MSKVKVTTAGTCSCQCRGCDSEFDHCNIAKNGCHWDEK